MGHIVAFDTHSFVKQLITTGFTEEQAETQVRLLSEIWENQLSTKADVAEVDRHVLELKQEIKALDDKIETTRADLKRDIKAMDTDLRKEIATLDSNLRRDLAAVETNLKRDTKELETNLKRDLKELETNFKHDLKELEYRMVIKTAAMLLALVALLFGIVRTWPLPVHIVSTTQGQTVATPVPSP